MLSQAMMVFINILHLYTVFYKQPASLMKTKEKKNHNRNKNRTTITGMYSTSYPHIEHVKQCTPVQEKKQKMKLCQVVLGV